MIHNATFLCFSSFDHPRKISSKLPRKNPSASSTSLRKKNLSKLTLQKYLPPLLCSCLPQQANLPFLFITSASMGLQPLSLLLHVSCRRHPTSARGPLPLLTISWKSQKKRKKKTNPPGPPHQRGSTLS